MTKLLNCHKLEKHASSVVCAMLAPTRMVGAFCFDDDDFRLKPNDQCEPVASLGRFKSELLSNLALKLIHRHPLVGVHFRKPLLDPQQSALLFTPQWKCLFWCERCLLYKVGPPERQAISQPVKHFMLYHRI